MFSFKFLVLLLLQIYAFEVQSVGDYFRKAFPFCNFKKKETQSLISKI